MIALNVEMFHLARSFFSVYILALIAPGVGASYHPISMATGLHTATTQWLTAWQTVMSSCSDTQP